MNKNEKSMSKSSRFRVFSENSGILLFSQFCLNCQIWLSMQDPLGSFANKHGFINKVPEGVQYRRFAYVRYRLYLGEGQ